MRLARAVLNVLQSWGARHVFLVPGAQIDGFGNELAGSESIVPIVATHELAAGYMADGYVRAGGRSGIAMAIGGPGAANMLGAAAAAQADASPVLFVTGNIPQDCHGRGEFQDGWPLGSNDSAIYRAAIGMSEVIRSPRTWAGAMRVIHKTLARRRPAHLAVPLDVQYADVQDDFSTEAATPNAADCAEAAAPEWLLAGRPVLALGAHAIATLDAEALHAWAARAMVPVVTDLAARGIFRERAQLALGHIGFLPHPRATAALGHDRELAADTVISVGMDARMERFYEPAMRKQVVKPEELQGWLRHPGVAPDAAVAAERAVWIDALRAIGRPAPQVPQSSEPIPLGALVEGLASQLPENAIYCVDAGQIRRLAIARLQAHMPRTILVAEGMAPMGWGICAAIGAKLAQPRRTVIALTGDGSMRMHGAELATAARYGLPILFVVCDNQGYGSVAARDQAQQKLTRAPGVDWEAFAGSLGVSAARLNSLDELGAVVDRFQQAHAPQLLVVDVPWIDADAFRESTAVNWLPYSKG